MTIQQRSAVGSPAWSLVGMRIALAAFLGAAHVPGTCAETPAGTGQDYFAEGTLHLICSSHNDLAWSGEPARHLKGQRDRIAAALKRMDENAEYRFSLEMAISIRSFWEHPETTAEMKDKLLQRMREGRLTVGATFTQPGEASLTGEQLVRELYWGRKWLRRTFPPCDPRAAWNQDTPGRTLQMPQILAKGGVRYLLFSRHAFGLHRWRSPDGSSVIGYSPYNDEYWWGAHTVGKAGSPSKQIPLLDAMLKNMQAYYASKKLPPHAGLLITTDELMPANFDALLDQWNGRAPGRPPMQYATAEQFLDALTRGDPAGEEIAGEQPNVWVYEYGPAHRRTMDMYRRAGRSLVAAEAFAACRSILAGRIADYPADALDAAWRDAITICHGWRARHDEQMRAYPSIAAASGDRVRDEALAGLASRVKPERPRPIVVFNDLSWTRDGPVEVAIPPTGGGPWIVVDAGGKAIPCQPSLGADGKRGLIFVATDVPALGYTTYYLAEGQSPAESTSQAETWENRAYRLRLAGGGIASLFDKSLGREMLETSQFLGGEVLSWKSRGAGAGEYKAIHPPTAEGFWRLAQFKPAWKHVEAGLVRDVFRLEQTTDACDVRMDLACYRAIRRIDIALSILDLRHARGRELRIAFPVAAPKGRVVYDVPFGTVAVGKDEIRRKPGWGYSQLPAEFRPREVQHWIFAGDDNAGLTLSTSELAFDYGDMDGKPATALLIQPILIASILDVEKGDHHYRFSLASHPGDWKQGWRDGTAAHHPLLAVLPESHIVGATLQPRMSFCTVEPANVTITALKKCQDDASLVVRLCEREGKACQARLTLPVPIREAKVTDLLEEHGRPLDVRGPTVTVPVGPHAIETIQMMR